MNRLQRTVLLVAALGLDACATTEPPAPQVAQRPRRRRRPVAAPAAVAAAGTAPVASPTATAPTTTTTAATAPETAPGSGLSLVPTVRRVGVGSFEPPAGGPSMGSPVVRPAAPEAHALTARWMGPRSSQRIVCEGEGSPQRASTQSPYDPTSAMIVRAFLPVESRVLACAPPVNREGRVPVRVLFSGTGLPLEVSLSGDVTRAQGLCVGTALCNVRLAAFRAPNATVNYGFVAALPSNEGASPEE